MFYETKSKIRTINKPKNYKMDLHETNWDYI